ncbi:MAG: pyruvate, water dikinase [Chloroflexi bacterium]|nr:pyruvate, water dikinase [Chloroflexota bacterium]
MTIAWFHEIDSNDINLVGGKGANLGRMTRAGLPVPPGFCVTTKAYKQFINEMNLWTEMEHLLATLPAREAGGKIRQRIENASMPEAISKSIKEAYANLSSRHAPVAVRSSATAEDLADASFAGQQETYLGIRGDESLTLHVQRCWASLWTERAIAYRAHNNFPHDAVSLSVVVQEMIAPDVAGVLFTVNPVTNSMDEMLINASFGLGESVVSGRVTPDTYRVRRKKFAMLEIICGSKSMRIDMAHDNGTTETVVDDAARQRLCLDADALRRLLDLGSQVEAHYGKPQDIEWGLANGQLYLLQTRPITSLLTVTAKPQTLNRTQHEIVNDILEHYPEPPYPLDYFAVTDSYQQLINTLRDYGVELPPSDQIILLNENGLASVTPPKVRMTARILSGLGILRKNLQADPNLWIDQKHASFESEIDSLRNMNVAALNNSELIQFIQSAVDITSRVGAIRFRDFIVPAIARSAHLKMLMGFAKDSKTISIMDLLGDLPYKTAVIDRALKQLAREAEKLPQVSDFLLNTNMDSVIATLEQNAEGKIFLEKVNAFLNEHGARTMKMYLPFSNRSWSETPATLLTTIAVLLRSKKNHTESNLHYAEIRQRLIDQTPAWFRSQFISTLEKFRIGHIARESTLYTIEAGFLQARRGMDESAQRLLAQGALSNSAQIIYLTLTELYTALNGSLSSRDISQLILRREKARPQAMKLWRGQLPARKSNLGDTALKGLSGSSGYAEGIVRVINGPAEFDKLQPGDVLVCPYTDPAWTPLFTLACAVVSDTGGPLSHAAIVAREYGIPAVLGTKNATSKFREGDLISVDGQKGEVRLVKSIITSA